MQQLPSGTVTFLFTDIEGSTKLLEELGERYEDVLADHRWTIREAFGRHEGAEVDTQGDAFFVAFPRASDAVAAAVAAQAALSVGPVRVRMGLHTGEPSVAAEGYVGIDVHRAARIGAAANGGQIVLSPTTRQLLDDSVELRDLGEHRLKDFPAATRLFQVGRREFPPLRTPDEARLPAPAAQLVGRKKELSDALRLLHEERVRVLTVTGPGGVGKTRFAVEAATESLTHFTDGARFADLSALRSADSVLPAIAQTVRASHSLEDALREQNVLLVLDNFEHLSGAAPALAELLDECRGVAMLVTSREPLYLGLERELPLRPMAEAPAVELFRQRVRMTDPDFEGEYATLAQICERLDGLPLAIELAAARVKALGESGLLARLDQRLPLLTGRRRDVPERQRTLRATIEWSYYLLDEEEQRAFAELAVFVGGFTLDAAEAVARADLDLVESLVHKSLLRREDGRFSMLETIREFALERLASADEPSVRARHAEHYLAVADSLSALRTDVERSEAVERFGLDYDDVMVAANWFAETEDPERRLRVILGCNPYWSDRGPWREAGRLTEEAVAGYPKRDILRASGLSSAAWFAWRSGRSSEGLPAALESLEIAREVGGHEDRVFGALIVAGITFQQGGEFETSRECYEEAEKLAREFDSPRRLAMTLSNLGNLAISQRDLPRAKEYLEEAIEIDRANGHQAALANSLVDLGFIALSEGMESHAINRFRESVRIADELALDEMLSWGLAGCAALLAMRDRSQAAASLLGASAELRRRLGAAGDYYRFGLEHVERAETALREQLGEHELAAALSRGATISREQAVELAGSAFEA